MTPESRILFAPFGIISAHEMIVVAKRVREDGKFIPAFFLEPQTRGIILPLLQKEGFSVIGEGPKKEGAPAPVVSEPKPEVVSSPKSLRESIYGLMPGVLKEYLLHRSRLRRTDKVLSDSSIRVVVVTGDRYIGWETALLKSARDRKIPSLIIPCARSYPDQDGDTRLRHENPERTYGTKSLVNRIVMKFFPEWSYEYKGRRMLFLSGWRCLAAWMAGTMPARPWVIGGGLSTRLAMENAHALQLFEELGIPRSKMTLTGRPSMDLVAATLKEVKPEDGRKALGIGTDEKMLLCAVPQMAEHRLRSWEDHWNDIEFIFSTMAKLPRTKVILSLHPKSDPENYRARAAKHGAIIATDRIYKLLPLCDAFVATFSSTIDIALALGKPLVIVDIYGFGFHLYDDAPGIWMTRSHEEFLPALQNAMKDIQEADSARAPDGQWEFLDGKCTERVTKELYTLAER